MLTYQPLIFAIFDIPQNINSGDYYYRTFSPGFAMSREDGIFVVSISNIHPKKNEILNNADVVVLNDICDPDLLPVIRARKEKGLLTFFEIADDLNGLQPWNPVYSFYKNPENIRLIYKLANCCDGLQFSVLELQRFYGGLNNSNRVFNNQILKVPFQRTNNSGDDFIIGWGGSHGHLEDMSAIANPLIEWILTKPNVKLHLMCSRPILELFKRLPKNKLRHFSVGSIEDYFHFLSTIHIGIAPLEDTSFNRSRSDVKFLEYAVSGVVPVLTNLEPYKNSVIDGETGYLFNNTSELIEILTFLKNNKSILKKVSVSAREYVLNNRMQSSHIFERLDFYKKDIPSQKTQKISAEDLYQSWCRYPGSSQNGSFLTLSNTEFEKSLFTGLVMMQDPKKIKQAKDCFQKGARLESKNYLPHLYSSGIAENPIGTLSKAIHLEPSSIKAHILLGDELAKRGNIMDALGLYNRALIIYPEYDLPFIKAGNLLMKIGKNDQAEELFQKASCHQVKYSIPSS